jgi:hypothetical protein
MKRYRSTALAALLFAAPQMRAEFLQIDMSIFGMD